MSSYPSSAFRCLRHSATCCELGFGLWLWLQVTLHHSHSSGDASGSGAMVEVLISRSFKILTLRVNREALRRCTMLYHYVSVLHSLRIVPHWSFIISLVMLGVAH